MHNNHEFTIGRLAKLSGFSTDTIRYYEKMGIISMPDRAANGYRIYTKQTVDILHFIRRAKVMNFTLEEIRLLLTMADHKETVCGEILDMVEEKIVAFKKLLADTQIALNLLEQFAEDCPGGQVPANKCPFMSHLKQSQCEH